MTDDPDDLYSYETDIDVRLRDIDFMGHVNNAVYATFLEEAREAYFVDVIGVSLPDIGTVLATMTIDYVRAIEADDRVTVSMGVTDLGTSSLTIGYEIRAEGETAATAETVQVLVDRETGESKSLPDEWRTRIDATRE
ncbi:acyl-CoA thioesterase [Natronorubrum daqingense]|uniref:Acyl-CoA thioester hydrolase n=1 Tax=Natronorubrum daqingense TaxID=588898 RepID=A0A1N6XIB2_9EURY|nr:thioesterase family protein [Natronorubrum daqingense]APX95943.1 thioesterase [Natronorubrum daqingense]SIR02126.1 acyl-CoA thioester hydrolase [Natronorubrum daqingense]